MPFRDPRAGNLASRIETGIRERLQDAVDAVCLEAMARARKARGAPPPATDNVRDRAEYTASLEAFLDVLRNRLLPLLAEDAQAAMDVTVTRAGQDSFERLMVIQIGLARALPDYWQRFEEVSRLYIDEHAPDSQSLSGGERRGLLDRLLGRG